MFFSVVLSYLPYALVTSFTPGPNNILAFHTVGQKGWVQGRATLAGIVAGFFSVMAVCALGCYQLERLLPALTQVLPFAGALYLFWLALHLLRSTPAKDVSPRSTFWSGFFLQFVNGKIILYAITIYTGYVLPAGSGALFPIQPFVLTLFGTAGFLTWAVAGGLLQSFLRRHTRAFNGAMAAVLALCALDLLFESVAPHPIPHGFRADRATTARQATRPPETSPIQQTARAREGTGSLSYRTWISHRIRP